MKRPEEHQIRQITTKDGSATLELVHLGETYHSRHGAEQESIHVFIEAGYRRVDSNQGDIVVLEIGFGTGLNAFLTAKESAYSKQRTVMDSVEPFPVPENLLSSLAPSEPYDAELYAQLHNGPWNEFFRVTDLFELRKLQMTIEDSELEQNRYHLVYYDAFGPNTQPEMWEQSKLKKVYESMKSGGIFVTYCAKGQVRRDLIDIGFQVERLPGPPGKREMLRAIK